MIQNWHFKLAKKYILFTDEELDDLRGGREIEHPNEDGSVLYFMHEEHFKNMNTKSRNKKPKEKREAVKFDAETKASFRKYYDRQSTVMRCDVCGLYYKPSLGHRCKEKRDGI